MNMDEMTRGLQALQARCLHESGRRKRRGRGYTAESQRKCRRQVDRLVEGCHKRTAATGTDFMMQRQREWHERVGSSWNDRFVQQRHRQEIQKWDVRRRAVEDEYLVACLRGLFAPVLGNVRYVEFGELFGCGCVTPRRVRSRRR